MSTPTLAASLSSFPTGSFLATPGALTALAEAGVDPYELMSCHARKDWGDIDDEDRHENALALVCGWRLLSAYTLPTRERVWIITEADHSATTILLPSEY